VGRCYVVNHRLQATFSNERFEPPDIDPIRPISARQAADMECDDALLFQKWVLQWRDLAEFEIVPVSTSMEVRALFSADSGDQD
jgi:hypothetical protein